jgi:pantothenate kinase-related protein Tda10
MTAVHMPLALEFEVVCRSFARWIVQQKRLRRPSGLFLVGANGTIGQGKTVFSLAVAKHLDSLLKPEEGHAVTRSLDDYYLPKAERYRPEFLARGYNPEGIPNRGPAGTHDTARLWQDIQAMEATGDNLELPSFDKQIDDRSSEPYRIFCRVGVFILEGWFVGAKTRVDPGQAKPGLKRSVAEALRGYQTIFDRLDALWVFEPPKTFDEIVAQRIEQQHTLNRDTIKTGMTPDQIRRFIDYFYKDSWQSGLTSPTPPREAASFWAVADSHHRFLRISPNLPFAASRG